MSFCVADLEKLNGCLEKLTAKLVLQGTPGEIICSWRQQWGLQYLQEAQGLPVNIQMLSISLPCETVLTIFSLISFFHLNNILSLHLGSSVQDV